MIYESGELQTLLEHIRAIVGDELDKRLNIPLSKAAYARMYGLSRGTVDRMIERKQLQWDGKSVKPIKNKI